jgi:5-methylcytosine-specific restriction endonuclease McrA
MKTCTNCKTLKAVDQFHKDRQKKDGLAYVCKPCAIDKVKQWQKDNPDKTREHARKFYSKHKDSLQQGKKIWRENNRDRVREMKRHSQAARRARANSVSTFVVTKVDLRKIRESACAHCDARDDIHIDHIIPLAKGGAHSIGNLQPLCAPCNQSKGSKLLAEWRYQYLAPGAREAQEAQRE